MKIEKEKTTNASECSQSFSNLFQVLNQSVVKVVVPTDRYIKNYTR